MDTPSKRHEAAASAKAAETPRASRGLDAMAFVDSHTEGEPTRVVLGEGLGLEPGSVGSYRAQLAARCPNLRAAMLDEPRGYPALVGALLLPPEQPGRRAAVMFLNNVGELPMCVHASIGVAHTLVHLGRMPAGPWTEPFVLETAAGEVSLRLERGGYVAVGNVPAYRLHAGVELDTRWGRVRGDVAWGGNWFFIVEDPPVPVEPDRIEVLDALTKQLRSALVDAGICGAEGAEIDHIQLCGPSEHGDARNFVMCPGGEHDRSACGTGTSARLACLHADGRLKVGQRWRQESITGTYFIGEIQAASGGRVSPVIRGRAWISAEGRLLFADDDPFAPRPGRAERS